MFSRGPFAIIAPHLQELLKGKPATIPLSHYNIHCSPFSLLYQDRNHVVLVAEDQSKENTIQALTNEIKRLRAKDNRVHILLDESSDPIFGFEKDGTYIYVNNVFARTMGYEKEDIIGKKIWDIFSQEEADKRFATVQKVFSSGETATIEVRVPLPQGGDKFFHDGETDTKK